MLSAGKMHAFSTHTSSDGWSESVASKSAACASVRLRVARSGDSPLSSTDRTSLSLDKRDKQCCWNAQCARMRTHLHAALPAASAYSEWQVGAALLLCDRLIPLAESLTESSRPMGEMSLSTDPLWERLVFVEDSPFGSR